MIKKSVFIILSVFSFSIYGQRSENKGQQKENGDVVFDDGTVINFKFLSNDPDIRSDWFLLGNFNPIYIDKLVNLSLGVKAEANLFNVAELYGQSRLGLPIDFNILTNVKFWCCKSASCNFSSFV